MCNHPPNRLYSWFARDDTTPTGTILCVTCRDCGAILKGGTTITRTIAGHTISLEAGHRYVAMRPLVRPGAKPTATYTITIYELHDDGTEGAAVTTLPDLPLNVANAFLTEFNTAGPNSLDGRVW